MKKKYETPTAEFIEIDFTTNIVASGTENIRPGHGYGDKNHTHQWKWINDHYEWVKK